MHLIFFRGERRNIDGGATEVNPDFAMAENIFNRNYLLEIIKHFLISFVSIQILSF